MHSLGRYYSISLNKGAETVPLCDEIQLVQNYLSLQKLRYGAMIEDHYNISEDTGELHVLRNILQPLVENSIYHGIKPSGEPGSIFIEAHREDGCLVLAVRDNGMGMTEEEQGRLSADILNQNLHSFGVRGTIKRAKLFCNRTDI